MLEDVMLMWRLRRGSKDALRRIYEKYKGNLLKLALAMSRDACLAEDVVHDVFLRVASRPDKVSADGSLKAFLRVCVLNEARRVYRREKVFVRTATSSDDPAADDDRQPSRWVRGGLRHGTKDLARGRAPIL